MKRRLECTVTPWGPGDGAGTADDHQADGECDCECGDDAVVRPARKRCISARRLTPLDGIIEVRGPQFGGGGWGGPFHVGSFNCFLQARGSDFKIGMCWRGTRYVTFANHTSQWNYPDPGFHLPALKP